MHSSQRHRILHRPRHGLFLQLLHVRSSLFPWSILILDCYQLTHSIRNSYCDSVFNDRHDVIALEYPGTADLRNLQQGDYNDGFYSYQCFEKVE